MDVVAKFQALATDERFIQDTREIIRNELFYQPTDSFFKIVPGVKGGQQVAAMKGFEYVTKASAGCGGNGISPEFPAFSQFWNPKLQEVKISYCYDDFMGYFTQWALSNGYQIKDLGETELALFIQDFVQEAVKLDMQRIVLCADKDIAEQDILTDPVEKAQFYDTIDKGLIPTLLYLKTLPEFQDYFKALDKNTGIIADQMNLGAEYALDIYESLTEETYEFDPNILLSSNKLFKNYAKWIKRTNGYDIQGNIDRTIAGVREASVDGVPLSPIVNYDRWKRTDFTTAIPGEGEDPSPGDTIHIPHFALLSRKEYLQVGVDSEAAFENLTFEYVGGSEEMFWIKCNYMLDFKMVNPYALKAAI